MDDLLLAICIAKASSQPFYWRQNKQRCRKTLVQAGGSEGPLSHPIPFLLGQLVDWDSASLKAFDLITAEEGAFVEFFNHLQPSRLCIQH